MYYSGYFPQVTPDILSPMGVLPIYYANTNLYRQQTQQSDVSILYADNQAIAQCCHDAQYITDLQNRVNSLIGNTYSTNAMPSWTAAPDVGGYILGSEDKSKKTLTLDELNRILFPDDPIRDWSERTISAIDAKYAWLNEYK